MATKTKNDKEFKFIGKCMYFTKEKILALADLHIGYEECLNDSGVFIPRSQLEEMMQELQKVFEEAGKIHEIVVVGDLKHEFGAISSQEWREVKEIVELFKRKAKKVVLVKGNHDTILAPIAERKELEILDYYIQEDICFLHGDKLYPECLNAEIKMLVMGHRHPAVMLSDEYKREKFKCFLAGKWKGKKIIILPSFFPLTEGGEINQADDNKMFISEKELKEFEVYAVGDKAYNFGKLKEIM